MNSVDLAFAPALEQAQLIRSREVSPLELVELYLERIQRLDAQLGSYLQRQEDPLYRTNVFRHDVLRGGMNCRPGLTTHNERENIFAYQ